VGKIKRSECRNDEESGKVVISSSACREELAVMPKRFREGGKEYLEEQKRKDTEERK